MIWLPRTVCASAFLVELALAPEIGKCRGAPELDFFFRGVLFEKKSLPSMGYNYLYRPPSDKKKLPSFSAWGPETALCGLAM